MANTNAPQDEHKARALELLLDAWDTGLNEGIEAELLATAAIFAALTDMVDLHGQDAVAKMAEELPGRIRSGEFTLADEEEED